ncbi:putative Chaperone protein DnaJ [Blattamonas nauphoetae]|uniref:Chaperone protein DnaJ n=1 Tax=Blattamonas nauphoetae TaxID=2049346 RepID=A0ABQ9X976_9EUKA|nr:putative Chaperone protein DnaJ [Blattamonas nauphoetae]
MLAAFICLLAFLPSSHCAKKDLYQILGVSRDATQQEIKTRYRTLSKTLHPDKNRDDPKATEKYAEITNAYEVLGNPDSRRQYDFTGSDQNIQTNKFQSEQQGNPFGAFPFPFGGFGGGQQFTFNFGGFDFGGFGGGQPGSGGQRCVTKKMCNSQGVCRTVTQCS